MERTSAIESATLAPQTAVEPICPHCGSHEVLKASAAYEQGTSKTKSSTRGVGLTLGGGVGLGGASTTGISMSLMAKRNAPPKPGSGPIWAFLGIWLGCSIVGFAILPIAWIGGFLLGILTAALMTRSNLSVLIAKREAWQRLWYCMRCGNQFASKLDRAEGSGIRPAENGFAHLASYHDPNEPKNLAPRSSAQ